MRMSADQQLVVCALGAEQYGLPIAQVREIVRYVEPRPVAADAAGVRGVISLRGRLLPVYDMAVRLGLVAGVSAPPPPSAKIVVIEAADELAGFVVDEVVEVRTVTAAQLEDVPVASATDDGRPASIARLGERLVLLLDPTTLLADSASLSVPSAPPIVA
jgi:purine-binding chemotaxis protein CheW